MFDFLTLNYTLITLDRSLIIYHKYIYICIRGIVQNIKYNLNAYANTFSNIVIHIRKFVVLKEILTILIYNIFYKLIKRISKICCIDLY